MPETLAQHAALLRTSKVNVTLPGRPDSAAVSSSSAVQSLIGQLDVQLSRIQDIITTQGDTNLRLVGQVSSDPPRPHPEGASVDTTAPVPLFVQTAALLAHLDAAVTELGARVRFLASVV